MCRSLEEGGRRCASGHSSTRAAQAARQRLCRARKALEAAKVPDMAQFADQEGIAAAEQRVRDAEQAVTSLKQAAAHDHKPEGDMGDIPTQTAASAAADLGVSVGTIYKWLKSGKIREHGVTGQKIDGQWVIMTIADAEPTTHETVEARIREIYPTIARKDVWGRPDWCSLTDLRKHLAEYPRQLVSETLARMERTPNVNIVPEANQKVLTDEDWDAAVWVGGQRKHLFCITD